jgi:rubrerythrin
MLDIEVHTVGDLMSIALHAEHEAVRRYTRLAEDMHQHGNQEAASLFERMIEEEQGHEHLIEEWARLEGIQLRTDIGPIVWEDPRVPTDYDADAVDPVYSTAYRALAFAVHNEERAFHFYTYVVASTDNETVREYAETLAREELGHAALLRTMRRRAWRLERKAGRDEPDIEPGVIHSLADLLAVAASAEHCLADNINALADGYPELQTVNTALQRELAEIETRLKTVGQPGDAVVAALESIEDYRKKTAAMNSDARTSLQRLCTDSDRCFAFYDAVVRRSTDEDVMLAAQQFSESSLERVGMLRDVLGAPV